GGIRPYRPSARTSDVRLTPCPLMPRRLRSRASVDRQRTSVDEGSGTYTEIPTGPPSPERIPRCPVPSRLARRISPLLIPSSPKLVQYICPCTRPTSIPPGPLRA